MKGLILQLIHLTRYLVCRCLMALSVPFFHHELVKQAVHLAMNSGAGDQREAILGLLDR